MSNEDRWHSVNEVAVHLGVAVDTVYRWIENKSLPAHRIGRLWKCKLSEVDGWDARAESASRPKKICIGQKGGKGKPRRPC
jgi:excisionase family DNA binding protein